MAVKSKFFRVAREGDTTDGRKIERSWIEQIVETFNREKYGARIWMEHLRSYLPDGPFKAYGDVLAVKAEEVQFDDGKKLCLFAQVEPTEDLITMNKARQKIYTSCEIDPQFAGTGKAYLVGLGVTDSPASLGTEILAFAAGAKENPLAAKKQNPNNVFTEAIETTLEFEDEEKTKEASGDTLLSKVKGLLGMKDKNDETRFSDVSQAVEAVALAQKSTLDDQKKIEQKVSQLSTKLEAVTKDFSALYAKLSQEPDSKSRPPATGSNTTITTDC